MNDVGQICDNPKCRQWVEKLEAQCPYCGDEDYCDVICLKAARKYHIEKCSFSKMQLQEQIASPQDPQEVMIDKIKREAVFQQEVYDLYIRAMTVGRQSWGCMAMWLRNKEEAKFLVEKGQRLDPTWFCHMPLNSISKDDEYMEGLASLIKTHNPGDREVVVAVIYQPDRNDRYKEVYPLLLRVPPDTSRVPMVKE